MSIPFQQGTYRGLQTSLYSHLTKEAVHHLEKAIWFRTIGQPDEARAIFSNELQPLETVPIILIEHANLELQYGRWGKAWRILDHGKNEIENSGANMDLPEHRLITMTWAMIGIRHRGNLEAVTGELERMRQWLEAVPVADYTDIQAACIRRYVIAYLFLRLQSNFQNPALETIPLDDSPDSMEPKPEWNGLHLLRRSLTARGMFHEANENFRIELNRTPLKDRTPILAQFLDEITPLTSAQGRDLIEAEARLQWASTCVQLHDVAGAMAELERSTTAFVKWCEEFGITETYTVPHFHSLLSEKIALLGDHASKLSVCEQCIPLLEKGKSGKLGSLLSHATDSAYAMYESTGDNRYLSKFFDWHTRMEEFDEFESEDLCDLVRHRISLLTATVTNLVDRPKSLEWIDGFFKKYDYFKSPSELELLHRQKAVLLRALRRLDEAKVEDALADYYQAKGPTIGKWLHISLRDVAAYDEDLLALPDSEDEEDVYFIQSWPITALTGPEETAKAATDLVLEYLFEDVCSGRIKMETFLSILAVSEGELSSRYGVTWKTNRDKIKEDKWEEIRAILFPRKADLGKAEMRRWYLTEGWLSNPPKGHRNKRLFCLLMLRNGRQYEMNERKLWDMRITELKNIIDLGRKLPVQVRKVVRPTLKHVPGCMADTYMAKVQEQEDIMGAETEELLVQAEKYNEQAVNETRRYYPDALASQQRVGATICLTRIRRLQKQLKRLDETRSGYERRASIESEIRMLRDAGLERLKETEEIFTTAALQAGWLDGLAGVNDRQRISKFTVNNYTINIAINLLLAQPGKITEDIITDCWNFVQKSKARALAGTVGIRSPIPEGLRSQITASPVAHSIYEEWLQLQDQVEKTEESKRFDLRKRIDAQRLKMKQHPLLRRLFDIREGNPLSLEDINKIEEEAGGSLVFVDWFVLPGFPDESERNILLFTARANGETTMDILPTRWSDVKTWHNQYLHPTTLMRQDARNAFNKALGTLVEPLGWRTRRDEILVLCPSRLLYRFPLHALSISEPALGGDGEISEVLIHRNPVVYIQSHSLLRPCFSSFDNAQRSLELVNPQIVSGIPRQDVTGSNEMGWRYKAGRDSIKQIAMMFKTRPYLDEQVSKQVFLDNATKSRLLHIHTHCSWKYQDPLDHHIEFPVVHAAERRQHVGLDGKKSLPPEYKLTAKEVFDIRLLPGTHVSLIACSGGQTDVQTGDEVMGLVPALLYSGAGSTISTLWNIDDRDGAKFATYFYKSFIDQCATEDSVSLTNNMEKLDLRDSPKTTFRLVNLAEAMQDALAQMDPDRSEPLYKWAGYILHGFWQFPVSEDDVNRFQEGPVYQEPEEETTTPIKSKLGA